PAEANASTPVAPATIRELHLAQIPNQASKPTGPAGRSTAARALGGGIGRIHQTTADAVIAALRSAYEVIPRDELLAAIQGGSPLTRAAALAGGGGRLEAKHLPILLAYADDNDPHIQRGALMALRHFGE